MLSVVPVGVFGPNNDFTQFRATANYSLATWRWDFRYGAYAITEPASTISVRRGNPAVIEAQVVGINEAGEESDPFTFSLRPIWPLAVTGINETGATVRTGETLTFHAELLGIPDRFEWEFWEGGVRVEQSTEVSPSYTFRTEGRHEGRLTAYSGSKFASRTFQCRAIPATRPGWLARPIEIPASGLLALLPEGDRLSVYTVGKHGGQGPNYLDVTRIGPAELRGEEPIQTHRMVQLPYGIQAMTGTISGGRPLILLAVNSQKLRVLTSTVPTPSLASDWTSYELPITLTQSFTTSVRDTPGRVVFGARYSYQRRWLVGTGTPPLDAADWQLVTLDPPSIPPARRLLSSAIDGRAYINVYEAWEYAQHAPIRDNVWLTAQVLPLPFDSPNPVWTEQDITAGIGVPYSREGEYDARIRLTSNQAIVLSQFTCEALASPSDLPLTLSVAALNEGAVIGPWLSTPLRDDVWLELVSMTTDGAELGLVALTEEGTEYGRPPGGINGLTGAWEWTLIEPGPITAKTPLQFLPDGKPWLVYYKSDPMGSVTKLAWHTGS